MELANELTRLGVPFAVYSGEREADTLPAFQGAKWINKPGTQHMLLDAVAQLLAVPARKHG